MGRSEDTIAAARSRFDAELHTEDYRTIHGDDGHRTRLLDAMDLRPGGRCLDLGTGGGYMAFAVAERFPRVLVDGLDIAAGAVEENRRIVREGGIGNASFVAYDGGRFPFEDGRFPGAVSRYAFHHFPDPRSSIAEISRVLEPGGFFLFSDPRTLDGDAAGFIDAFQELKDDGHVHYYRRDEIVGLFGEAGFFPESSFDTHVRYPREMDGRYRELFESAGSAILEAYRIEIDGNRVFVTVPVMNILFRSEGD